MEREILAEMGGKPDLIIGNYRWQVANHRSNSFISLFAANKSCFDYLIFIMCVYCSDGNLVATLLCKQLAVCQCNIAHALEKTKYTDADTNWLGTIKLQFAIYWQS